MAEIYVRCGNDPNASMGTLQMLTTIETRLEDHLLSIDQMVPEMVDATEKAREKDRRRVARDEKMEQQVKEHEAKLERALERARAPAFKKVGKPVMARSQPPRKREVVQVDSRNDEEAELEAYLNLL